MLSDDEALRYLESEQNHIIELKNRSNRQTKHLKTLRKMIPMPSVGEKHNSRM